MGIIIALIIGLVAGAIAKLLMPGKDPGGIVVTMLLVGLTFFGLAIAFPIALPVAAADRQRVLAVSVLVCEKVLARLDGRREDNLSPDSVRVLGAVPHATQWADRFTSQVGPRLAAFRRQSAPDAVRFAVEGAAYALIPDPDVLLRRMLVDSIDICAAWTGKGASDAGVDHAAWAEACRLTVATDGR